MAKFKSLPLASIYVGERARPVDQDHAQAIAASMSERGLINPITVRSTPAMNGGETPYTLVAGGHRFRGAELNHWVEIDAIVVNADAAEAQLIELSENLFRNELSALDRGLFVVKFREVFEEKHGKIARGGSVPDAQKSNRHGDVFIFAPGKELSARVQERLGFGASTYERATKIGLKLHPALRQAVRGTNVENDQKMLLKLAGMPDAEQAGIAAALKHEPDLQKVLDMDKSKKPKLSKQQQALRDFLAAWRVMDERTRREALAGIDIDRVAA